MQDTLRSESKMLRHDNGVSADRELSVSPVAAGCKNIWSCRRHVLVSVPFMRAEVCMNLPVCEHRGVFLHRPDAVCAQLVQAQTRGCQEPRSIPLSVRDPECDAQLPSRVKKERQKTPPEFSKSLKEVCVTATPFFLVYMHFALMMQQSNTFVLKCKFLSARVSVLVCFLSVNATHHPFHPNGTVLHLPFDLFRKKKKNLTNLT